MNKIIHQSVEHTMASNLTSMEATIMLFHLLGSLEMVPMDDTVLQESIATAIDRSLSRAKSLSK